MAKQHVVSERGFSLVELLVAMVFISLLMAGMATVFKSSLQSFYSTGEKVSTFRRNRVALDVLYDDLNMAGLLMESLYAPDQEAGKVLDAYPPFWVDPDKGELYFAYDQPLPFEATLVTGGKSSQAEAVLANRAEEDTDRQYTFNCGSDAYANMVASLITDGKDVRLHIKDQVGQAISIESASASGSTVDIVTKPSDNAGIRGLGRMTSLNPEPSIPESAAVFFRPKRMVRYRIVNQNLDPQNPGATPCLIREQGQYSPTAVFASDMSDELIGENISGFAVYLSVDAGKNWVPNTDTKPGWAGMVEQLSGYMKDAGRADFKEIPKDEAYWFRDIPVLMRIDVTSRSAMKRADFSPTGTSADYHTTTQSMVINPRHFGLTMRMSRNK